MVDGAVFESVDSAIDDTPTFRGIFLNLGHKSDEKPSRIFRAEAPKNQKISTATRAAGYMPKSDGRPRNSTRLVQNQRDPAAPTSTFLKLKMTNDFAKSGLPNNRCFGPTS